MFIYVNLCKMNLVIESYKDADKVRQSLPSCRKWLDYDDQVFFRVVTPCRMESFYILGGAYEK